VLVAGASSSVGSLGAAVAVEREHAKIMCGDDSTALRKLNAGALVQHSVCLTPCRRFLCCTCVPARHGVDTAASVMHALTCIGMTLRLSSRRACW
jgi:hypothetical protein